LAHVALSDKRYDEIYEPSIRNTNLQEYATLNKEEREGLERRRLSLLLSMGWPGKFLAHKYVADLVNADLEKRFYRENGIIMDINYDPKRVNDELNRRVDEVLADLTL
jgi:hypothetical protein